MNKKVTENYERLAQRTGLKLDRETNALFGARGGYDLVVYAADSNRPYLFTILLSAKRDADPLDKQEIREFVKANGAILSLSQKGTSILAQMKGITDQARLGDALEEALQALTAFAQRQGFQNCCQMCGEETELGSYFIGGSYMHLCQSCFDKKKGEISLKAQGRARKKENLIGGIAGALIGSAIGAVIIVLLGQLGYVAWISGAVMAVCALKGYELLGGRLSVRGIVISVVCMILMCYLGNRIDWAIFVAKELDVSFADGYTLIPLLLDEDIIAGGSYYGNLAVVYLFCIIGAVPTILGILSGQKEAEKIHTIK